MRVKYKNKIISKGFSVPGGTDAERKAFLQEIMDVLYEMGAPLDLDNSEVAYSYFEVELTEGTAAIGAELRTKDDMLNLDVGMFGNSPLGDNSAWSNTITVGDASGAVVCIHAVKSGDSFFFGFLGLESDNPYNGCITYAITPMRRLSDPSVNLGYAIVEGASTGGPDEFVGGTIHRTLPYIEGFNYAGGRFNFTTPGYAHAFPEVDTGKIPLIPYYAGIEDIYYDKVYISPMKRGKNEEKAFETDKGVFLIGGEPGVDHTQMHYNTLAFDITEAVESAQ